jgi:hypothetical protein
MQTEKCCAFLEAAAGRNGVVHVKLAVTRLEIAPPYTRFGVARAG